MTGKLEGSHSSWTCLSLFLISNNFRDQCVLRELDALYHQCSLAHSYVSQSRLLELEALGRAMACLVSLHLFSGPFLSSLFLT